MRGEPDLANRAVGRMIRDTIAVSIHVRRLHGVSADGRRRFEGAVRFHGACGPDYYQRAIDTLSASTVNPHFFVFSDDPAWAQTNLHFDGPIAHITHNGPDKDYEDFRLMSLCKHHVIANSSFGWWAAWLNISPDKMVIAPRRWFRDENTDCRDPVPDAWLRI